MLQLSNESKNSSFQRKYFSVDTRGSWRNKSYHEWRINRICYNRLHNNDQFNFIRYVNYNVKELSENKKNIDNHAFNLVFFMSIKQKFSF